MLPPEVMRVLLLIGLAATGYMLIQAWNADYMQRPIAAYAESPLVAGATANASDDPSPAVDIVTNEISSDSDVPEATILETTDEVVPVVASKSETHNHATAGRLVTVVTPTLKVWIDRRGGDVVRVQLPKYPVSSKTPDVPYLLMENSGDHTYVAQSGLMGKDGLDGSGERPLYDASTAALELSAGEQKTLSLKIEKAGQRVTKTFAFNADSYLVGIDMKLENMGTTPLEAALFAQIKRDDKAPIIEEGFSFGPQSYLGGALTTPEERYLKVPFDDLEEAAVRRTVEGGWIALLQHYFVSAWVARADENNNFFAQKRTDGLYVFGYTAPKQSVPPGATGHWQTSLYAGPKDQHQLDQVAPNLGLTVDYGFLWWLAVPLFDVMSWLHDLVGNWGLSIILLTVMVKIVLYPLFNMSYKSMAKLRKVAPELKLLQERYADDRQKLSQEMMKLYQKEGANPLGGCLPMLLPMPVFLALYWVLWESVELRQAPFFLWIQDLSAMDPYFVLPLLMGGTMYLQQTMAPAMGDPMQQRMMKMMPVIFTAMFLFFPAGLVLYWLVNNVLSVAQQWYVTRSVL